MNAVDHPARILAPKKLECNSVLAGSVRLLKGDEHACTAVAAETALAPENGCWHDMVKPIAALRTLAHMIDSLGIRARIALRNGHVIREEL